MSTSQYDQIDLFGCDHYPPWARIWKDGQLICHKCGEILKFKKTDQQ